jgi:hypothetical protein
MPTFNNNTNAVIYSGDPMFRFPADTTKQTDKYPKELPTGITLTDHEPIISPWVLLATVASTPMEAPVDTYGYDNVVIYNASDETAMISANTDDDNSYPIMASSKEVYSNSDRIFGCIEVLSKGDGNVYIYGVR